MHFADIVRCVAFVLLLLTAMTQRYVTLKDVYGYIMLENFIGHICRTLC